MPYHRSMILTAPADDLSQLGNASWLVTGYLITESAFQPMVRLSIVLFFLLFIDHYH